MKRVKLVAAVVVVAAVPFAVVEAAAGAHHANPYTNPYTGWGHGGFPPGHGPVNGQVAVSGTVVDPSGAPVDGVTVTAKLKSRGVAWGFGKAKKGKAFPRHGVKPASHGKKFKPSTGKGNPFASIPVSTVTSGGAYTLDVPKNATYTFVYTPPATSGYETAKVTVKVGNTDKTLDPVTLLKAAPTATTAPAITPSTGVAPGSALTATPGTWSSTGATYAYQWFRDGLKVKDATASTYAVTAADAGSQITVGVTATTSDSAPGYAVSAPVTVAKVPSTTTATATTAGSRHPVAAVRVTVTATGVDQPTGWAVVKEGDTVVGKAALFPWNKGVVTVPLARLAPGTHTVTVTYSGSRSVDGSTSPAVSVAVPEPATPTTVTPAPEPVHHGHGHR